ncbi:MAG TPA: hypothetical protein VN937_16870 [Blastocatellia bacterium]|nr:hypothetical protein [Blastocatellia bacterium]
MNQDNRDSLQVLKAELDFIEKGGYGRSVKTPWQPTSVFQDSPSCLNLGDPERAHPCTECPLIDFVPSGERTQEVPCHHIPLDISGRTIDDLEWNENQRETEDAVKDWLRATIKRLEAQKLPKAV